MNEQFNEIKFDEEGFLINHTDWTEELAKKIADCEEIYDLSPRHFEVIYVIREEFSLNGESPTLRRLTKVHGFPTKELYQLFPGGPGKKAAKISGVKKPHGCI
jgi:TusE/DsrC/DsvC family sulfur relay protein